MLSLALVLELHHPLPGPRESIGREWARVALESGWPALRALHRFAEAGSGASVTLAVSPSWMALASEAASRAALLAELNHSRSGKSTPAEGLSEFVLDQWNGDAVALVRHLSRTGTVEVIPTTSSHTWLPSVVQDPVLARSQVKLAAADHALRLGSPPQGLWLPFLAYLPGLETVMGEAGLRYFGVTADSFLRGTLLPPHQLFAPMTTPSGVAAFGVNPRITEQVAHPELAYGRDPRYRVEAQSLQAADDHSSHFVGRWVELATGSPGWNPEAGEQLSVASIPIADLGGSWPSGQGAVWLDGVLSRLASSESFAASSLGSYLDRHPSAVLGRPGPSAGGQLAARPAGSDLFDRIRAAADLLTFVIDRRREFGPIERRSAAQMVRSLLQAQQVDWSLPPGHGTTAATGLQRAQAHLDRFYAIAGSLMAGRPDRRLLDECERESAYLPEIDLDLLAAR